MTPDTLRALVAAHRKAVLESQSPWCSVETAAIYLGVSRSELYKLRKAGRLRAYGVEGKTWVRFRRDELDQMLRQWVEFRGEKYISPNITATQL